MTNLLGRIYDFANDKVTADVDNSSVTTEELLYKFPDQSTESIDPLIPNINDNGQDADDSTALDFDISLNEYDEYLIAVDFTATGGDNTARTAELTFNNNTTATYSANEVVSGTVNLRDASNWRFGYYDSGNNNSYRVTIRVTQGPSASSSFTSLGVFTVPEVKQPAPINGHTDGLSAVSSIQLSTTGNATGQLVVLGVDPV
jgi:hypothetical protein